MNFVVQNHGVANLIQCSVKTNYTQWMGHQLTPINRHDAMYLYRSSIVHISYMPLSQYLEETDCQASHTALSVLRGCATAVPRAKPHSMC